MITNPQLTEDEQNRLDAYCWSSPRVRREIIETYETIARGIEDEGLRESVIRLLNMMRGKEEMFRNQ